MEDKLKNDGQSSKDIPFFYIVIAIVCAIIINTIMNNNNIMAGLGGTVGPTVVAIVGLVSRKPRLYFLTIFIIVFLMASYGTLRAAH